MNDYEVDQLNERIADLTRRGYRVENRTDRQAILVRRRKFSWWMHLPLVVVTGGLWLFVAVPLAMRKQQRVTLTLDSTGVVTRVR